MGDLHARGLAQGYAAGRAYIRRRAQELMEESRRNRTKGTNKTDEVESDSEEFLRQTEELFTRPLPEKTAIKAPK